MAGSRREQIRLVVVFYVMLSIIYNGVTSKPVVLSQPHAGRVHQLFQNISKQYRYRFTEQNSAL